MKKVILILIAGVVLLLVFKKEEKMEVSHVLKKEVISEKASFSSPSAVVTPTHPVQEKLSESSRLEEWKKLNAKSLLSQEEKRLLQNLYLSSEAQKEAFETLLGGQKKMSLEEKEEETRIEAVTFLEKAIQESQKQGLGESDLQGKVFNFFAQTRLDQNLPLDLKKSLAGDLVELARAFQGAWKHETRELLQSTDDRVVQKVIRAALHDI